MHTESSPSYKWILEYCVLLVIARQDAYITDIVQHLRESDIIMQEGAIYPLLTRLKNGGCLTYRWEESVQGPPRKYYCMTARGKEQLRSLQRSWDELQQKINELQQLQ